MKETKPMTFEQTIFDKLEAINGVLKQDLKALQAEYDRLLAINNQLRVENAELEKRIEELE